MRLFFNIFLVLVALALTWVLYKSIEEPIAFNDVRKQREDVVKTRLVNIRTAQELYRDINGTFAPNFDTLTEVLQNGRFTLVKVIGDPDDPSNTAGITYDTTYMDAADSIATLGLNLNDLRYVPFTEKQVTFDIAADTITYQSTPNVAVVEVGTKRKTFMGKYADPRYARYDERYDPNKPIKFGDLNKPNLSGNWEN